MRSRESAFAARRRPKSDTFLYIASLLLTPAASYTRRSYDWGKGAQGYKGPQQQPNRIYLHYTPEEEIKQRAKKGGKR